MQLRASLLIAKITFKDGDDVEGSEPQLVSILLIFDERLKSPLIKGVFNSHYLCNMQLFVINLRIYQFNFRYRSPYILDNTTKVALRS